MATKNFFKNIQPVVIKETKRVAVSTLTSVVIMWVIFAVLHYFKPEKFLLDYTVFLAGIIGGLIAVLNFFLMGLTVQKVASSTDEDAARMKMKASYSQRMMLQMIWVIIAITAPCFHFVAGIAPLLFPGMGIKLLGILHK